MSKIIDATLRFVDRFTNPMNNAVKSMERSSKQAQRMGKDIQKAGKNISNVGASLTTKLTLPIAAAGVASFKLASDLNESVNKVDVAFGKNAKNIKNWSKTTLDSYGIAQGTALDMAATYGDMSTGMGLSTKAATKMSKSMVGLAGDIASFKNISIDQANTALTGIFTGETESLKKLGIVMTETNLQSYALSKGMLKSTVSASKMKELSTKVSVAQQTLAIQIKKHGSRSLEAQKAQISLNKALENQSKTAKGSYKDLTQQEKVMVRYKYIMDMTKNSQGDFARTSSGAANQQRIFTQGLKQLGATMGSKLLPIGTKLITWANGMIKRFSGLSDKQQNMIIKIAGVVAAVGPCVFIIGKMTTGVGSLLLMVGKAGRALRIFRTAGLMAAVGPGAIVVAVIAAIAIAAFLIIKNWTKVKAFLGKFGTFCKSIFTKAGGNVKIFGKLFTQAKTVITNAINNMKPVINNIRKFMTPIVKFLKSVFVAGFKIGFKAIGGYVSAVVTGITGTISGLLKVFDGITTFISGVFTGNWSKAWTGVKKIFGGIFDSFAAIAKTPINAVIGIINGAVDGINSLGFKVPKWVPLLGGKKFAINIPKIPMLYKGTKNWNGGLAVTQDRGGEIMDLPRGTRVYPHDESVQMAKQEGSRRSKGNVTVIIKKIADKIEVRNDKDIDKIIDGVAEKFERIWNNTGEVPA